MKKLCIGTFFRILSDSRRPSATQKSLLKSLLSTVKEDTIYDDSKYHDALLSGKNNLSNYDEIKSCDKVNFIDIIKKNIEPYFDEAGKKLIIVCIRHVLKDDLTIHDSDNVGFESEGYTKQDIINKEIFYFPALIANVFYYCAVNVQNIPFKDNIKEIKGYTAQQMNIIDEIQLETITTHVTSTVKLSIDPLPFDTVFKEVSDLKLSLPNPNDLKIYRLDVVNSRIDYSKLHGFIADNIGRYIFSRGTMNRYDLEPNPAQLTIKALRAYHDKVKKSPTINHFNEIMLYSFLECILGAPKIFSKMELQNKSGMYDSFASGIHINTIKTGGTLINQLIFGASETLNTLEESIDTALCQVLQIQSASNDEYNFLETTILNNEFDAQTNIALEDMIIPKKGSGLKKPDNAFGLFLGYTVKTEYEPNNALYITNLEAQMKLDITNAYGYLNRKLNDLGLLNYSFYIYVLPLNDAIFDKDSIMKDALSVGE